MTNDAEIISDLQQQLRRKESELNRAGEAGELLISKNDLLKHELSQALHQAEQLKQINFNLTKQVDLMANERDNLEVTTLLLDERTKLQDEYDAKVHKLREKHSEEKTELMNEIERLTSEIEERVASERKLCEDNELLESRIRSYNASSNCADESVELTTNLNDSLLLRHKNLQTLEDELIEKEEACRMLQIQNDKLAFRNEELQEENGELVQANLNHCNKLEKRNERIVELTGELDAMRLHDTDRQGNSLFAEVEDRRIETQQKNLNLQQDLKKSNVMKERLENVNIQLMSQIEAMTMKAHASAEKEYIGKLSKEVSILNEEKKDMVYKILGLEKEVARLKLQRDTEEAGERYRSADTRKDEFDKYMVRLVKDKDREIETLKRAVDRAELFRAQETAVKLRAEKKNFEMKERCEAMTTQLNKLKSENTLLKLKSGQPVPSNVPKLRKIVEKLPDTDDEEEKELDLNTLLAPTKEVLKEVDENKEEQKPITEEKKRHEQITKEMLDEHEQNCAQQ